MGLYFSERRSASLGSQRPPVRRPVSGDAKPHRPGDDATRRFQGLVRLNEHLTDQVDITAGVRRELLEVARDARCPDVFDKVSAGSLPENAAGEVDLQHAIDVLRQAAIRATNNSV